MALGVDAPFDRLFAAPEFRSIDEALARPAALQRKRVQRWAAVKALTVQQVRAWPRAESHGAPGQGNGARGLRGGMVAALGDARHGRQRVDHRAVFIDGGPRCRFVASTESGLSPG